MARRGHSTGRWASAAGKRVAIAALAAGALIGLSACGGETDSGGSGSGSTAAESAEGGGGNADRAVGDTVPMTELSERTQAAMQEAGSVRATMSDEEGETATLEVDYATGNLRMSGIDEGSGPVDLIKVGDQIFIGGMDDLPEGKSYVVITGEDSLFGSIIAPIFDVIGKLTDASVFAVEGVDATVTAVDGDLVEYEARLTAAQVEELAEQFLDDLPSSSSTSSSAAEELLVSQTIGAHDLPVEMTVTGDDEPVTIRYDEWGASVEISAPDSAEIATFEEMMGDLMPDPSSSTS